MPAPTIADKRMQPANPDEPTIVTSGGSTTVVRFRQFSKSESAIRVMPFGMATLRIDVLAKACRSMDESRLSRVNPELSVPKLSPCSDAAPKKARDPMLRTESGKSALITPDSSNAEISIAVKVGGKVTTRRALQPINAEEPMVVMFPPSVTLLRLVQTDHVLFSIVVTPSGMLADLRLEQFENAAPPMDVTRGGIRSSANRTQLANACISIAVTESESVTEAN